MSSLHSGKRLESSGDRRTTAKHDLSQNTHTSFDLPRLSEDLNNKICLSKFLNRLSLLWPSCRNPRNMFTLHPY